MRSTILGLVLAIILIGGLFAAAHFLPHNLASSPSASKQTVQALRPGFYGVQRYGAWTLECLKPHRIPAWAAHMVAAAKSKGIPVTGPRGPLCHVITRITKPGPNGGWIDAIFSFTPKGGFLTAVMRLAPDLAVPGEYLTLHLSAGDERARVIVCGPPECVAVPVIRPQDILKAKNQAQLIASSKTAVLAFPAGAGTRTRSFSIPTAGLQTAIAAMRRMTQGVTVNHPNSY